MLKAEFDKHNPPKPKRDFYMRHRRVIILILWLFAALSIYLGLHP